MRERAANPMDINPPQCGCRQAQVARADVEEAKKQRRKPRCQICRLIAVENPGWTAEQVAKAGARRWQEITPKQARPAA